jgi:hypothetical protein
MKKSAARRVETLRRRSTEGSGRITREISRIEGQNDLLKLLEALDAVEADEKGDGSEDAEAAVDGTPEGRDAAEGAGDEGERNDGDASDHAELEHPFVADGIAQRAEEGDGQDEVGEGEPVGSVGEERVVEVGVKESGVNSCDPKDDRVGKDGIGVEEGCQPGGFLLEREGGEAAEDEPKDEEGEPEADGADELRLSLELG